MIAAVPNLEGVFAALVAAAVIWCACALSRDHHRDRARRVDEALEFGRTKWADR